MLQPNGDFRIRPARSGDIPGVLDIISRIFAEYGYVLDTEREDTHLRDPCGYFRSTGGDFWVAEGAGAEQGGLLAGSAAVKLHGDHGEIKTVYIDYPFRRRGIARALVRHAINHVRESGRRHVTLWSDTRFAEAHRMYESLGFIRGERKDVKIVNTFSEYRFDLSLGTSTPRHPDT